MSDLRDLREAQGYSQEGAAGLIGCSRRQVQRWEHGDDVPSTGSLVPIARTYQVSVTEVMHAIADIEGSTETRDAP